MKATEQKFGRSELLSYPLQHHITKEIRRTSNKMSELECAGLWCGQANRLSRKMSAKSLMKELEKETVAAISELRFKR